MVVGMVVRVRNRSSRTFHILQAGDPFYSPKIGGMPFGDEPFEVPPGFDEAAEGLVVPWAATSSCGLLLGESSSSEIIRCVVGPCEQDDFSTDWLRMHDDAWEPLMTDRWLSLGKRHWLGAFGGTVDIQLTFRDHARPPRVAHSDSDGMGLIQMADSTLFELEAYVAPPNTVFLNVFDLVPAASLPNQMLNNTIVKSFGAFHAAVEVYGDEWSFYRQPSPEDCGICRSRQPRKHPVHIYRQSVNLGTTALKDWEVWNLIRRDICVGWPSKRYNLIHCNCIHFCDEFLRLLGVQPAPSWVRGLHETGAALMRPIEYLNSITARDPRSSSAEDDPQGEQDEADLPLASRLSKAFNLWPNANDVQHDAAGVGDVAEASLPSQQTLPPGATAANEPIQWPRSLSPSNKADFLCTTRFPTAEPTRKAEPASSSTEQHRGDSVSRSESFASVEEELMLPAA